MKTVSNNLLVLMAQKAQRERRRITPRTVAMETGISRYTIYAFVKDTIQAYPRDVVAKLCEYLDCEVGDLLLLQEVEE
jgi:DNA-binding Xre family transcriptional regulator